MLVEEGHRAALKDWVVPKLETISDADAAVLADYVIALIVAEDTEEAVRTNCLDSLPDFLHENTGPFIDEVLTAVKTKAFLRDPKPSAASTSTAPISTRTSAHPPTAPTFNPPTGPASLKHPSLPGTGTTLPPSGPSQSRKRRHDDSQDGRESHHHRGPGLERPTKQLARRGGRNSRADAGMSTGMRTGFGGLAQPMPSFPPPLDFPALDPANFMSLLTMLGIPGGMPGMPPFPFVNQAQTGGRKKRCRDYDTKGYCALGSACPYEHGGEIVLAPSKDEYDPAQAALGLDHVDTKNSHQGRFNFRGRNEQNGGRSIGNRSRAAFSQAGPNFDHSRSTVVVEQIPEEHFSEEAVRGFFSQFGNIIKVNMQAYKRLAIVKFADYHSARRSYDSPKVIFDNRFVKVYWYNPDSVPKPPLDQGDGATNGSHEPLLDSASQVPDKDLLVQEEIEQRQAEAQKAFEERRKKAPETEVRLREIESQMVKIDKKLHENDEQKRLLHEALARHGVSHLKVNGDQDDSVSHDATLIDQLASLQREAEDLRTSVPRGHSYGRGFLAPSSRGTSAFRGGYRGRGGFAGTSFAGGRSGVKRWDNRPRKIAVAAVKTGSKKDESLREHLLSNFEYDGIEPHHERVDTQVITFKERYVAEMFLDRATEIPDVTKSDLSWVPNASVAATSTSGSIVHEQANVDADIKMEDPGLDDGAVKGVHVSGVEESDGNGNAGNDFDVAEDEDQWL